MIIIGTEGVVDMSTAAKLYSDSSGQCSLDSHVCDLDISSLSLRIPYGQIDVLRCGSSRMRSAPRRNKDASMLFQVSTERPCTPPPDFTHHQQLHFINSDLENSSGNSYHPVLLGKRLSFADSHKSIMYLTTCYNRISCSETGASAFVPW